MNISLKINQNLGLDGAKFVDQNGDRVTPDEVLSLSENTPKDSGTVVFENFELVEHGIDDISDDEDVEFLVVYEHETGLFHQFVKPVNSNWKHYSFLRNVKRKEIVRVIWEQEEDE